jgi:FkbM family methyltransferase
VQKYLTKEFTFKAFDKYFFYDPRIEGSYDYLLIGKSNEPETHILLNRLINQMHEVVFIDVGASVGEFVNLAASHSNVKQILAFEPRNECYEVLLRNSALNKDDCIEVINSALSNKRGEITFSLNAGGSSSGIYALEDEKDEKRIVQTRKLDELTKEFKLSKDSEYILLIDVEGAEPLVLEGAENFIKEYEPTIIFEYNNTSKKYYNLDDIRKIIGKNYEIRRLKTNGELDEDFSNSWNCVAIPQGSEAMKILSAK